MTRRTKIAFVLKENILTLKERGFSAKQISDGLNINSTTIKVS